MSHDNTEQAAVEAALREMHIHFGDFEVAPSETRGIYVSGSDLHRLVAIAVQNRVNYHQQQVRMESEGAFVAWWRETYPEYVGYEGDLFDALKRQLNKTARPGLLRRVWRRLV